jgi:hypothetical protein
MIHTFDEKDVSPKNVKCNEHDSPGLISGFSNKKNIKHCTRKNSSVS